MIRTIAALRGTTVSYHDYYETIVIETLDSRIHVISRDTFDYLYCKLDQFTAALKEDCIEYTMYDVEAPLACYPDWLIEAYDNGWITDDYGTWIFLDKDGELAMSPNSVVLRNYMGDLKYMEYQQFNRYYETIGG